MEPVYILPHNDADFETMCCNIAKEKYNDHDAQKYGRRGQKQWGVDIVAVDYLNNAQKVVIQSKFKSDPPKFSASQAKRQRTVIKEEILAEFDSAILKHSFDKFIYASTFKLDNDLQEFVNKLSEEKNKVIKIWFIDDIKEAIQLHPRLTRLHCEGLPKSGITLIDQDFIDHLTQPEFEGRRTQVNSFRFYSGRKAEDEQWRGILHNLDAPRSCTNAIVQQVDNLFDKPILNARVAAVVYGSGGCGKSTLLRHIAIKNVTESKGLVNWWVEDIDLFLDFDAARISNMPSQKHLIFIDDWYRNRPSNNGKKLFSWLNEQRNVLIIIGDRRKSSAYSQYVYDSNYIELQSSENRKILDHFLNQKEFKRLAPLSSIVDNLVKEKYLLDKVSISVVLFVITYLYEKQVDDKNEILADGVEAEFRLIIRKLLLELEDNEKTRGLGKALYLIAQIYADPRLGFFMFNEPCFLEMASLLGDNPTIAQRILRNKTYPEQLDYFIHKSSLTTKSGIELNRINFIHDVLAENGIIYADSSALDVDEYDIEILFEKLSEFSDKSGALMLWIWRNLTNPAEISDTEFTQLLDIVSYDHGLLNYAMLLYIIKKHLPEKYKNQLYTYILSLDGFEYFAGPIASLAMVHLKSTQEQPEKYYSKMIYLKYLKPVLLPH